MSVWSGRMTALAAALLLLHGAARAADEAKRPAKDVPSFGVLRAPAADAVKAQARQWLDSVGKTDPATAQKFDQLWASDRPVLDKVADTLALGDAEAAKLLTEARDPAAPAPTAVPPVLKDARKPAFYRANLALAYGKALSGRRVYEEALAALKAARPEQVCDPAAYFFHRAVAEYALILKPEAEESIVRLLDDVADAPERYRTVAALMQLDLATWRDKDLGWIARKMDNIERRLELVRGGKQTQKMQKEVLVRLDEMIKQLENQQKDGGGGGGSSQCPPGGPQQPGSPGNTNQPSSPMQDSQIAGASGKGEIDPKKLKEIAEVWGKLPEKEQARRMLELTRGMPARYRDAIETYLKQISARSGGDAGR